LTLNSHHVSISPYIFISSNSTLQEVLAYERLIPLDASGKILIISKKEKEDIIDKMSLIKGKGRGRLVPTKKNRNVQVSKGQTDKGSDKIYFRRKKTEIRILFLF